MKIKTLFSVIFFAAFTLFALAGCAANTEDLANKSASFWYEKIITSLAAGKIEQADNAFGSLQSEHPASPLIAEATLLLAKAHIAQNEHLLAGFFVGEYKTRFSDGTNADYIAFLGVEASLSAFGSYTKDQGYINEQIGEIAAAAGEKNKYLPYIRHILLTFKLAKAELDAEIARIYRIKDKPEAQEKYEQNALELGVSDIEFEPSHIPWYVRLLSW